jgi:hypothetical protein
MADLPKQSGTLVLGKNGPYIIKEASTTDMPFNPPFTNHLGWIQPCGVCHYEARFKYKYQGEIIYRCGFHQINDISKAKSKYSHG